MSDSVRPLRGQPTRLRRPWESAGKNPGVGCHCLLQCVKVRSKVKSLSRVGLFVTPRTAAHQAPPSMAFSRQGYWSGCHCLLCPLLDGPRKRPRYDEDWQLGRRGLGRGSRVPLVCCRTQPTTPASRRPSGRPHRLHRADPLGLGEPAGLRPHRGASYGFLVHTEQSVQGGCRTREGVRNCVFPYGILYIVFLCPFSFSFFSTSKSNSFKSTQRKHHPEFVNYG